MFSRSAPEPVAAPASAETRFSLVELRKLHKQLVENKRVTEANQNMVVEILRVIAEMVVYGDNKSELLFDFFCEKNMLSLFLEIMSNKAGCPSAVHIQILQTLSILISCVRNETSLYYLLSNNYVNEIIIFPHDFVNDESLCAQFASFMKTLSLKLNIHTVQFFFIEESGAFPILTRAVELLTIPDPMIRIASQSTILNVYRVEDSRARAYALQDEVMGIMFAQTVNFMENQYHSIFKSCKQYYKACNALDQPGAVKLEGKLDDILSGMEDWFFYLQDLLDLDVPVLRKALVHQLIHDFLLPVLLNPLMKHHLLYQETVSKNKTGHGIIPLTSSTSGDGLSDKARLTMVLGDEELELFDTIELIASLSYLLQMLKIVTHQALQRAVLVTLFHPLSLDCRMEILKEIEATKGISAVNSTTDFGLGSGPAQESEGVPSSVDANAAPFAAGIPLTPNLIKEAWDRLHQADNHKITLIMMYIEHILFDRIVPTAIDCTPGNEVMVQHEVDEEYLASHCPAITPLRTLNDPTNDAITMLQSLYYLPDKNYCEMECSSAEVKRALNVNSASVTPLPTASAHQSGNSLSELSASDPTRCDLWSSDLALEDGELSAITANIMADCDAEAENGIASRPVDEDGFVNDSDATEPKHKEYGRLDRSGDDTFTSPPVKQHRSRLGRNDMLMPTESTMGVGLNSADQLMLPALRKLSAVLSNKLPYYPELKISYSVEPVFSVLCNAQSYSITAVQVAAHVIYSLSLLVASARNLSMPSPPSSKANSFSQPKGNSFSGTRSKGNSFSSAVPLPERSSRIFFPDGCDPSSIMNQSILEFFAVNVREAGRLAAVKLLSRLSVALPELVLNLVKEEIARLDGQKWKRSIERMYQDVLLFLPPTQFSSERMGIDFDLPISQTEILRKDLQVFMMIRALYKRLHVLTTSTAVLPENIDDLCASITDKGFLSIEERNLLVGNFAVGAPFDMRGKRFLDLKISPMVPKSGTDGVPNGTGASSNASSRTASPARTGNNNSSSSSTSWSKRLFGSSSSSASQNNSVVNSPASPMPGASNLSAAIKELDPIAQLVATKKKILFVQDPKSLIVVSCDKHDSKNGFKVLIAAPLMYADAQIDPKDASKFKLIVRSTGTVQHMYPVEPDMLQLLREGGMEGLKEFDAPTEGMALKADSTTQPAVPGGNKFVAPRLEAAKFLKNKIKTNFWQLTLRVESDQACKLAVHHIESRRKEQTANKVQQLQRILEHWASAQDVSGRDD